MRRLDNMAPLMFFTSVLLLVKESQLVPLIDIQIRPEVTAARNLPGEFARLMLDCMT